MGLTSQLKEVQVCDMAAGPPWTSMSYLNVTAMLADSSPGTLRARSLPRMPGPSVSGDVKSAIRSVTATERAPLCAPSATHIALARVNLRVRAWLQRAFLFLSLARGGDYAVSRGSLRFGW